MSDGALWVATAMVTVGFCSAFLIGFFLGRAHYRDEALERLADKIHGKGMAMIDKEPRLVSRVELAKRIEQLEAENKRLRERLDDARNCISAQETELEGWRKDAMAVVVKPQGMTAYNLAQADESAIRKKLVELGWTPPALREKGDE